MKRLVLDLDDRRPVWAMPAWVPERIAEALGDRGELIVIDEPGDGSGDGAARVSPSVLAAVEGSDAYFGYGVAAEILRRGESLAWVHSGAAGVGGSLTPEMRARDVVFTNSAGIHAPPMAETVLGMILHFGRGLDLATAQQGRGVWSTDPFYAADAPLRELSSMTVGIVGFGGVGRAVAQRVAALGARVVALRRTDGPPGRLPPVAGDGDLSGRVTVLAGEGGLARLLADSDVVVLCAPETDRTRGMIDRAALDRMKAGALLVNVGRGRLVVEEDLVAALREGRLRGAALDVFAREPLPDDHPYWSLPNVLVTPHVSAVTDRFWERETGLIVRNVGRFLDGAPVEEWENVVDKEAGY